MKVILRSVVFFILKWVSKIRYNVQAINRPEFNSEKGSLLISNHTSWIDSLVITLASDNSVVFVFPKKFENKWYFNVLMNLFDVIKTSDFEYSESEIKEIQNALKNKKLVCMFPEKAITYSGQMGHFYDDVEKVIADIKNDIDVYPIFIKGLFGSFYSRASKKIQRNKNVLKRRRPVFIAFGHKIEHEKANKSNLKQEISKLSVKAWDEHLKTFKTIPEEFIKSCKKHKKKIALVDTTGVKMSYKKALISVLALRELIIEREGENIGVMLPTTAVGAMFNMAVLMAGKNVVNLNYTSPVLAMKSAIKKAEIKTLYTSKQFIDKLEKRGIDLTELFNDVNIVFLEDEKPKITLKTKLKSLFSVMFLPTGLLQKMYCPEKDIDETATILFSSGSEGEPKGVMLTHKNIMTNVRQVSDAININDNDSVLGSLPLFHAFGLTVTTFWPMLEGMKLVCHPDPRDVVELGKIVYKHDVTIMCSTNSFLNLFNESKEVNPLMLQSIRMVVAGAEKVKSSTRKHFQLKFNKEIYEGYGATETGPVASANIPDQLNTNNWKSHVTQKIGTVGMALPGGAFRVVDPETHEELDANQDGMILISGNQVMKGYLKDQEKTDKSILRDNDGLRWYVTGDKGRIDEEGFLTIVDRYSRFAKIKGEMISLTALEQEILKLVDMDDFNVLAVNINDEKNGEKIALLIEGDVTVDDVVSSIEKSNLSYISRPKHHFKVDELPVLGSGKLDFKKAKEIVEKKLENEQ